jgi:hypothetical protein
MGQVNEQARHNGKRPETVELSTLEGKGLLYIVARAMVRERGWYGYTIRDIAGRDGQRVRVIDSRNKGKGARV